MVSFSTQDVHHVDAEEYSTAPLTLVLAGIGLCFSLLVIFRIAWTSRQSEDVHEDGKKGRRLRRILVICLLGSDFVIALGSVGPAAMVYRGLSLAGQQCNASGMTLALGLWWQYAFSILIALTTYLSLRHPFSRTKRFLDSYPILLVVSVLAVGIAQAVLWRLLRGYDGCHGFCFYGLPTEFGSELMQFLPRLLTSLGITAVYIPLIGFLRRPDSGAAYLGSSTTHSAVGRSRETTPRKSQDGLFTDAEEDIPPWEKLSFPTYTWDDKIKGIRVEGDEGKRSGRLFGALPTSMSLKVDMSPAATLRTFSSKHALIDRQNETPKVGWTSEAHSSVHFDLPTTPEPALLEQRSGLSKPAPLGLAIVAQHPASHNTTYQAHTLPIRSARNLRPSTAPATLAPHPRPRALSRCQAAHSPSPSISTLPSNSSLSVQPISEPVSFLNMLAYTPPTPDHSHRRTRSRSSTLVEIVEGKLGVQKTRSRSRSVSPEVEGSRPDAHEPVVQVETMASYMRRRTSYYLLCFPLTHFFLCIITIIRFTYFAARRVDDIVVDALTLVVVMGQGLADIVIFGLVEHRTRASYKREVASCMAPPPASPSNHHEEESIETLPTPTDEEPVRRIA